MSTTRSRALLLETALAAVATNFRKKIISTYLDVKRRHADGEYDAAGLSVGKLCETVLRFLQNELTGSHTPFGQKIGNFVDECDRLEKLPKSSGNESLRLVIPRSLVFLYTLRNKRGVGHVGGDVDANEIDSATMARGTDWILCELIRIYHKLSLEDAQALIDSISTRNLPVIWEVAGRKRVLLEGLSYPNQVLLLLYSDPQNGVLTEDLFAWTEYTHFTKFKKLVLGGLHKKRLVEYDKESDIVYISPTGSQHVEEHILERAKEDS
jgi:hypothetical protein